MELKILISLLTGTIAAASGIVIPLFSKTFHPKAEKYYFENPDSNFSNFLKLIFIFEENKSIPFKDRLSSSITTLKNATEEIDNVIEEIAKISEEKHQTISKLEHQLVFLEEKENHLEDKINTMEKVPVESMKYFEEVLNKGDKRSAKRDYLIFISGIIVTTIIGALLNKFL